MNPWTPQFLRWFAGAGRASPPGYLLPRWLFLRSIGIIYFSAFYSLAFQIRGLLGPQGLLPVGMYLKEVTEQLGSDRFWFAPTLFWLDSSNRALMALCWIGMIAAVLLLFNVWPRGTLVLCWVLFLSFVTAAQDFSSYQSDGMLLSAGLVSIFFAPSGFRPGWGAAEPPSRVSLLLLRLVWFSIYFDSGVAKYFGGDPSWRDLTAMDEYYQNGPLPSWVGWYVQQMPHWFHESAAIFTVLVELILVWFLFLPRPYRIFCFCVVTFLQVNIILTANYAFLNYIVLALGFLLLDDVALVRFLPRRWGVVPGENLPIAQPAGTAFERKPLSEPSDALTIQAAAPSQNQPTDRSLNWTQVVRQVGSAASLWLSALLLAGLLYANVVLILEQVFRDVPLPTKAVGLLQPFRVVNRYGLFGRMTWKRYEIEFQGSDDGEHWIAYPFRNKPQNPAEAPRIYAPYQPRFDWNLWFASLGDWRDNPWVLRGEELLLGNDHDVVTLFSANPFPDRPPKQVRAVLWQYWFTDLDTKRSTGMWWRREYLGLYAPSLERLADGKFQVTGMPDSYPSP